MSLESLNPEQFRAVTSIEGPSLIIAGAGSGKTGVITHRIAYMLENGIPQSHILALTFTNKAAAEMEDRVKKMTGKKLSNLTISTFHAFGVKILREQCAFVGRRPNFTIYDDQDRIDVIKEAAREGGIRYDYEELKGIKSIFSAVKSGMMSEPDDRMRLYRELYAEYEEFLYLKNAFDFDDLIIKPTALFEKHPEILEEYRKRYRYIMVDEFQDTGAVQYAFLRMLALGSRNICVVGDDDQSIYSWRGANYKNIELFEQDFPERLEVKLERNYRSTGAILDAANAVIANNSARKEKKLWTESVGKEANIQVRMLADETEESEFVCATIRKLRSLEDRPFSDFGVLVRTNALMRTPEEAFVRHNIPYTISGGSSFFDRKEIKDVIAYLRVADNPDDDIALVRIINTPSRGIGKATLQKLRAHMDDRKVSLFMAIKALAFGEFSPLLPAVKAELADFVELMERFSERLSTGREMAAAARDLVGEINYWDHLLREFGSDEEKGEQAAKWRWDNIFLFISYFERWEKNPDNFNPKLGSYLARIALAGKENQDESPEGKVNLITVHAAKGLEYDVVFILGVEDGIMPHKRSIEEDEANIEEERRLFYVAITRAREKLYLTVCERRREMRQTIECRPSPFLTEIPSRLVEMVEEEETETDVDKAAAGLFSRFSRED